MGCFRSFGKRGGVGVIGYWVVEVFIFLGFRNFLFFGLGVVKGWFKNYS